jgi:hypothetical protein
MAVDIVDLTRFYEAPLGAHVQARLVDEIARIWPHGAGANEAVLAYGYGLPLVGIFSCPPSKVRWHPKPMTRRINRAWL